ncbi:SHOCT domain-containing protein [Nocardioides sp. BP30]|uniref:SHOCT domain-containing protein n=1 Tax=Nocardioides sp. BP30 TaxID=3036374 RepID=UPI00246961F1|nr:SHOCT domain-containing protein [Nocardioides sp. BP30]WGL52784.1 SHOCT domain-containing protein [Nocardioides sp. BP30]
MKRTIATLGLAAVILLSTPVLAFADGGDDLCGQDPNCSVEPGSSFDTGIGIPAWFVTIALLMVCVGISLAVYRVYTARELARKAGLDQNAAGAMALLDQSGLTAAYLASSMRTPPGTAVPAPTSAPRPAAERLAELQQLKESGAITEDEYAARRQAIIDSV